MAVDERRRLALYDAVRRSLGDEEASTLMELLPPVEGRIDGLEGRIDGLARRIDGIDGRIDGLGAQVEALRVEMHAGFDRQNRLLMWLVPIVLTSTALSTAIAVAV